MKPKLLVVELWGLGDLCFSTTFLREAVEQYDIWVVAKPYARELLSATYPSLRFVNFNAPWTAYRGKYKLWRWSWRELSSVIWQLRKERFDFAVSARSDPRDHWLMWMAGARKRFGYLHAGSQVFLTNLLTRKKAKQHKVEDWRECAAALGLRASAASAPHLECSAYTQEQSVKAKLLQIEKPIICLHAGARIPVRRWPEDYFSQIVMELRKEFDFHLLLIPDLDGYGRELVPLADTVLEQLSISDLVQVLGKSDLVLCNDSGPQHIAAACGRPAIAIFGPTDPEWFRPWGAAHHVVIRDICPYRPCFDYCRFKEPYCMTKLLPVTAWPEIHQHIRLLLTNGILPNTLDVSPIRH